MLDKPMFELTIRREEKEVLKRIADTKSCDELALIIQEALENMLSLYFR